MKSFHVHSWDILDYVPDETHGKGVKIGPFKDCVHAVTHDGKCENWAKSEDCPLLIGDGPCSKAIQCWVTDWEKLPPEPKLKTKQTSLFGVKNE
jgi:hypothetical protein